MGSLIEGYDPNHSWQKCTCSCGESFTRESKGYAPYKKNVWLTQKGKLLRGAPSCFESYEYQCSRCEGPVRRVYLGKDGKPAKSLSSTNEDGKWVNNYTIHFNCKDCGYGGEVDDEYMDPKVSIE